MRADPGEPTGRGEDWLNEHHSVPWRPCGGCRIRNTAGKDRPDEKHQHAGSRGPDEEELEPARKTNSGGEFLLLGLGRVALGIAARQQNLAQHVKIATEHTRLKIAAESMFRAVPAPLQSVAGLQDLDGGLDAGMPLPRPVKREGWLALPAGPPGGLPASAGTDGE